MNRLLMDLDRVRYFCTIANTGSIRKAAELLHLTPPALSKSLHLLQNDLGVQLVVPSGRGIILTEEGRRLAKRGQLLLDQADQLRSEIQSSSESSPALRIATFEVFSSTFLSFLSSPDWKDTPLVLHDVLPGELERSIVENHADVGITYLPIPTPGIQHLKVGTLKMGVFTLASAFPSVEQNELPFVVPVQPISGSPTRVRGLDGWPEDAYRRKIKYRVTLLSSALELCRQGLAAGYFPRFVAVEHNAYVKTEYQLCRRISPYNNRTCTTEVYLVTRDGDIESKVHRRLAKAVRAACTKDH